MQKNLSFVYVPVSFYGHKIKQGVILVCLQEYGFFLHLTVHRETKSGEPQVKIQTQQVAVTF